MDIQIEIMELSVHKCTVFNNGARKKRSFR